MLKDGFCYLRIFSNNHRWHIATRLGTNPTIDHVLSLNTSWRRHDSFINCLLSGPFRAHISRSRRANPWLAQLHSLGGSLPVTVGSNHVPKLGWKEIAMDLEQQLEVARTAVEQLTVRLIPTKKLIPETPKELVELLRQIDQYQRPRPQTMTTASGGSDARPRQQPKVQKMTTAFGVSNARPRPRTPVLGPPRSTIGTPIPRPQTTTTAFGVSNAQPRPRTPVLEPQRPTVGIPIPRPPTTTTTSGISDARRCQQQRPQTTTTASGVSDARPRQVPQPKTMTTVSGLSDARPCPQPRPKATNTESGVSNVQPRSRLPVPGLPGPIPQFQVSQAALSSEKPNSQPTVRVSGFALKEEPMESLDGHHLIVKCTIEDSFRKLKSHSLVDCGASGFAFIDKDYAHHHNLPLHSLKEPRHLEVIDGRPIDSGDITHVVKVGLNINGHYEQLSAYVTKLGHYPLVLGIPWL